MYNGRGKKKKKGKGRNRTEKRGKEFFTHKFTKIINNQLDIKPVQFTQELNVVLRKIINRKATGLDEIPPDVLKTKKFNDILLRYCYAVYNQSTIDRWKGDLGIAKNNRGITLSSITAKIYYSTALNLKLRKFSGKTKIAFVKINPQNHKF